MRGKYIVALALLILLTITSCGKYPRPDFGQMPQDRARWANPAGYGLPKEVGE